MKKTTKSRRQFTTNYSSSIPPSSTRTTSFINSCDGSEENNEESVAVYDELLELYTSFINSYDGSADAFKNSEPIMKELFHPNFTFLTEDGPRDLRWYRDFAESFASRPCSSARVTHIERTDDGIRVTIKNVVAGVELDLITYDGTGAIDEDGKYKICYFEPVKGTEGGGKVTCHMENVGKMVQLATNSPSNELSC
jgi:hypothetical protein